MLVLFSTMFVLRERALVLRGPGAHGQRLASTSYSSMTSHGRVSVESRAHDTCQLDFCCCGDVFSFYHLSMCYLFEPLGCGEVPVVWEMHREHANLAR